MTYYRGMIKFLLDSGDPDEYRDIATLAKQHGTELWGATTNPSLIAKKLAGKKISQQEAFDLQKQIVMEILDIVPGAVSAEVYADLHTTADEMIEQGKEIATWHERIFVKLPTTVEGFKARTELRKNKIPVNNTLVFSQEQVYAICLHEQLIQKQYGPVQNQWPPFISPFVGRLDDGGENGMGYVAHAMKLKQLFDTAGQPNTWMLVASVRRIEHLKKSIDLQAEIITAPSKVYREWLTMPDDQKQGLDTNTYALDLKEIPVWQPTDEIRAIQSIEDFMQAIESNKLDIEHSLTTKGIERFTADWQAIIQS